MQTLHCRAIKREFQCLSCARRFQTIRYSTVASPYGMSDRFNRLCRPHRASLLMKQQDYKKKVLKNLETNLKTKFNRQQTSPFFGMPFTEQCSGLQSERQVSAMVPQQNSVSRTLPAEVQKIASWCQRDLRLFVKLQTVEF